MFMFGFKFFVPLSFQCLISPPLHHLCAMFLSPQHMEVGAIGKPFLYSVLPPFSQHFLRYSCPLCSISEALWWSSARMPSSVSLYFSNMSAPSFRCTSVFTLWYCIAWAPYTLGHLPTAAAAASPTPHHTAQGSRCVCSSSQGSGKCGSTTSKPTLAAKQLVFLVFPLLKVVR